MEQARRDFLRMAAAALASGALPALALDGEPSIGPDDRVFVTNEDSNTIAVVDPRTNKVEDTINLTSFDEDKRQPFRFVTAGVTPTHAAMVQKPLYRGCIGAHGTMPSPDGTWLAVAGRGSGNVYLVDVRRRRVVGSRPNPYADPSVNPERITSGVTVGREPHTPTFTRNGRELWVPVRGENRIAILDVELATKQLAGEDAQALRTYLPTVDGPSQVWFDKSGETAFVAGQREAKLDVFSVDFGADGRSRPERLLTLDISAQDKGAFTSSLKVSPDGRELWLAHKLGDALSARTTEAPFRLLDAIPLGKQAYPNDVEFVQNAKGSVVYASFARLDDKGPGGIPSSRIAIIDRSAAPGARKVVDLFFTHGREAHGLWTNPANDLLYVAHEQDELLYTANAGQTCCSAFDVSDPLKPRFIAQVPLGSIRLPSGELRNRRGVSLAYVRPGYRGQTA
ncbi:MAG TPA: beta-propeller fold lactonase family protein [Usitatibacter sp.]|nr:beta-propeller fold lactonase family protein [Usitatibacter sp.]